MGILEEMQKEAKDKVEKDYQSFLQFAGENKWREIESNKEDENFYEGILFLTPMGLIIRISKETDKVMVFLEDSNTSADEPNCDACKLKPTEGQDIEGD